MVSTQWDNCASIHIGTGGATSTTAGGRFSRAREWSNTIVFFSSPSPFLVWKGFFSLSAVLLLLCSVRLFCLTNIKVPPTVGGEKDRVYKKGDASGTSAARRSSFCSREKEEEEAHCPRISDMCVAFQVPFMIRCEETSCSSGLQNVYYIPLQGSFEMPHFFWMDGWMERTWEGGAKQSVIVNNGSAHLSDFLAACRDDDNNASWVHKVRNQMQPFKYFVCGLSRAHV